VTVGLLFIVAVGLLEIVSFHRLSAYWHAAQRAPVGYQHVHYPVGVVLLSALEPPAGSGRYIGAKRNLVRIDTMLVHWFLKRAAVGYSR